MTCTVIQNSTDVLRDLKTLDRLILRVALIQQPASSIELTRSSRSEYQLLLKYIEGIHMRAHRTRISQLTQRQRDKDKAAITQKEEALGYNLRQQVDGEDVALPFTSVPKLTRRPSVEQTPLRNATLKQLSNESSEAVLPKTKSLATRRKLVAKSSRRSRVSLNPLNEIYLGKKDSKKALKLLQIPARDFGTVEFIKRAFGRD